MRPGNLREGEPDNLVAAMRASVTAAWGGPLQVTKNRFHMYVPTPCSQRCRQAVKCNVFNIAFAVHQVRSGWASTLAQALSGCHGQRQNHPSFLPIDQRASHNVVECEIADVSYRRNFAPLLRRSTGRNSIHDGQFERSQGNTLAPRVPEHFRQ